MSEAYSSTPDPAPPYYPQDSPSEKKGAGCFLWGCIIAVILVVGGTTAVVGSGYYMFAKLRDNYTETQPMALPQVSLSKEERENIKTRFQDFREAVDEGTATEALILNEDEINVLIAENDSDESMKDAIRVQIEDDLLKSQMSLPLDRFPFPGMKGRYFNGTADLRASIKDGKLEVYIENASVKGEPLPRSVLDGLRQENLAQDLINDPKARKTLENIESMEIRDGRVIIVPKAVVGESENLDPDSGGEPESIAPEPAEPAGSGI